MNKLHAGNLAEAIELFTQEVEENPQNADAYFFRGKAFRQIGNTHAALNDFHRTLELNPNHNQAKVSIELINQINSFRNPDIYNA
ncbi:MAG TPA: tetratricopeptide repeat protein [Tenuifilaceae bacterium]|nr:tetratricopeptide repeat protein [Tenuifilaceae bacterium]